MISWASPGVRDDASVALRASRSIPPTGLRPWDPPAHEAAGGHGPLSVMPGLQDSPDAIGQSKKSFIKKPKKVFAL